MNHPTSCSIHKVVVHRNIVYKHYKWANPTKKREGDTCADMGFAGFMVEIVYGEAIVSYIQLFIPLIPLCHVTPP